MVKCSRNTNGTVVNRKGSRGLTKNSINHCKDLKECYEVLFSKMLIIYSYLSYRLPLITFIILVHQKIMENKIVLRLLKHGNRNCVVEGYDTSATIMMIL